MDQRVPGLGIWALNEALICMLLRLLVCLAIDVHVSGMCFALFGLTGIEALLVTQSHGGVLELLDRLELERAKLGDVHEAVGRPIRATGKAADKDWHQFSCG